MNKNKKAQEKIMINKCSDDIENTSEMQSTRNNPVPRPQKELLYNKLLPYVDELEADSQALLSEIKENLGRAVMLREIKPGCFMWSSRLCKYIHLYGMKFSKEDHIIFVKLMYELLTIPNLDPEMIKIFSNVLILLLKKKELISPNELELPWRPLLDLLYSLGINKPTTMRMSRYLPCLKSVLFFLIRVVKIYFPLNATQEILDELRPTLYPLDGFTMNLSVLTLEIFLPLQLPPVHHSIGHQLWFDEFMTIWKVCHNAPQWENEMMWLMARLANNNIGYIDWEPHFPLMFTRFVRCLNLPVSYKQIRNNKNHKIQMASIALWIVAVLGNDSNAQMYLDKLLKTIETYLYPANFGQWVGKLKDFLYKLSYFFISRLHKERYAKPTWETPIPEHHKLTDSNIDAFVKSMMPLVMTATFSNFTMHEACYALQYLASVRPNLVIPAVLERTYSTFDSVTEPHKLTASMMCMVAIARPMVQGSRNVNKGYTYPEGPTHVLPLLFSCLPGIDPNDIEKCFVTLRLIAVYSTLIPFVDCSRSTANMTEEERIICETTSRFEDFVLQFLDRLFNFIDSSSLEYVRPETLTSKKSKLESIAEATVFEVCMSLLMEASNTLFESALHKLRTFVMERILETKVAGQLAAAACRSFAHCNGRDTLHALVPVLSQTIFNVIGEDIHKEEHLDHHLSHAILILSAIVDTPGSNLIPHIDTLLKVLDHILLLKSTEGNNFACYLMKCILKSLSNITSYQYTSKKDYKDSNYPHIRDWGQHIDIDDFCIKWYIPGEEEITIIKQIYSRYLEVQVLKLKEYCKNPDTLTKQDLFVTLNIICHIIRGTEYVLPVWTEAPLKLVNSSLNWESLSPTYGMKINVTMPDGNNVRRYLVEVMSEVQQAMIENAEDDTKSFFVLIQIWISLLLGRMRLREVHDERRKNSEIVKKMFEDKLVGGKSRVPPILLDRCEIQHETRALSQTPNFTETHKRIMLQLFKLAISRYANVRAKAQSKLFSVLKYFPYSYTLMVPHILDILAMDTEEHHNAYKGVLYILLGPHEDPFITKQDWNILKLLWPAIILSKTSENLSVIHLKENIVENIRKRFPTIMIEFEIPDRCLIAAHALWENFPQPRLRQPNKTEIQKGVENLQQFSKSNLTAYADLLKELLRCISEEPLHWRHRLMAMNFIRNLIHPKQIYPINIVRYFLQTLIHESLEERKIATIIVTFILKQQKRKHSTVMVDVRDLCKNNALKEEERSQHIIPGLRADNSWLQYNYETRPLTAQQWDESRYVHKTYMGYYAWPKALEIYAPSSQQPCLDPQVRELTDYEKEIDLFFNDPHNIEKLIDYFSLEEKKGKDKFSPYRTMLFKGLFRNHGIAHLKHFLPHLQRLVTDEHESSQRCAAEITTGIIRGAKHWPFQMTCDLWEALLPIIRTALSNLTEETFIDWGICFATAQRRRDPNRSHWLLECLMEDLSSIRSESSFLECARLYILQSVLVQQSWRVTELLRRLLVCLEDRLLTNPFQNVREHIGSILVTVFETDIRFPHMSSDTKSPRIQTLISKIVPELLQLTKNNDTTKCKTNDVEENLSTKMTNISMNNLEKGLLVYTETLKNSISVSKTEEEEEVLRRLLKTVCKWITTSMYRSQYGAVPEFYEIFPIVCELKSSEADEEFNKSCVSTLGHLAQAFTLPEYMPVALTSVKMISEHSSWSVRFISLDFLQVLVFHNMGIILSDESWIDCIRNIVLCLLEDHRLEVREKAGQVLGGLLHCTFIADQEKLLEEFKRKAKTKLLKKNNSIDENVSKNAKIDAIRIRHASVLGLCAFIRAHPYDIPEYVPPILEHLGLHMNDPQPIPMTIRKTLGDFKRTHYDGWNRHAQNFTEEQLAVLQDLTVPPSHYT